MTYQKTDRKGALLGFLNLITVGVFFVFYLPEVRQEIGSFGKKKGMPFLVAYLLGLITFFLTPLVWFANRASELHDKAEELDLDIKKTSFEHAFLWSFFGLFILIGPIIACHRFFTNLNAIEIALNEQEEAALLAEKEEEAATAEEPKPEEEAPKAEEEKPVEPTKPTPSDPRIPKVIFDPKYAGVGAKTWTVKIDGRTHFFYRQSEAIAFAQRVARERGVNVVVKGKKG